MTVFFHKVFGKNVVKTTKSKKPKKWDFMFDGPLFQKGRLKEFQFSLKQMTVTHFICIIKWQIVMTFSFNENKQWKRVSV